MMLLGIYPTPTSGPGIDNMLLIMQPQPIVPVATSMSMYPNPVRLLVGTYPLFYWPFLRNCQHWITPYNFLLLVERK